MARPRSEDKALCHPALRLGSRASSGVEMAQAGPDDKTFPVRDGSERGLEEAWGRNGPGMFARLGGKEDSVCRVGGPGEGKRLESRKLRQEVRFGELPC